MRRVWILLAPLAGLAALAACDDSVFEGKEKIAVDAEGYQGVLAINETHCLGCHSAGSKLGDLDLETDMIGATVGVVGAYGLAIVEAGDPGASMYYRKITNTHDSGDGTDMPPGTGGLSALEAEIVANWILDGALPE